MPRGRHLQRVLRARATASSIGLARGRVAGLLALTIARARRGRGERWWGRTAAAPQALWELCFPGTPMRWVSLDQKPSWFNNAGLRPQYATKGSRVVAAKEDHNGTRQRYSLLTFVQSWSDPTPPKLCVLFKADRGDRILKELSWPDWMLVQTQAKGSYRAEDVIDALQWGIPAATKPEESIVVMLDWFSAHLCPEATRPDHSATRPHCAHVRTYSIVERRAHAGWRPGSLTSVAMAHKCSSLTSGAMCHATYVLAC